MAYSSSAAQAIPLPASSIPLFSTVAALRQWRTPILQTPPQPHRTYQPQHQQPSPTPAPTSSSSSSSSSSFSSSYAWNAAPAQPRAPSRVALVPTMGALHEGHLSLIRDAARACPHVLVSIFLNPAQFAPHEDLESYPATLSADVASLAALDEELASSQRHADADADSHGDIGRISGVFAPSVSEMYPSGFPGQDLDSKGSFVTITPVGEVLEGAARPTFFRGVATVVMKLLNAAQPEQVYLGQKDVQQTLVLRRMVKDFLIPTEVVVSPTVRDPVDGLALSSRNVYLGSRRRRVAPVLHRALKAAEAAYAKGQRTREGVLGSAERVISDCVADQERLCPGERVNFEVGYLSLADPETLTEVNAVDGRGAVLSGAIRMLPVEEATDGEDLGHEGGPAVRLIDNIILEPSTL